MSDACSRESRTLRSDYYSTAKQTAFPLVKPRRMCAWRASRMCACALRCAVDVRRTVFARFTRCFSRLRENVDEMGHYAMTLEERDKVGRNAGDPRTGVRRAARKPLRVPIHHVKYFFGLLLAEGARHLRLATEPRESRAVIRGLGFKTACDGAFNEPRLVAQSRHFGRRGRRGGKVRFRQLRTRNARGEYFC
jgi:hypothetical protein